MKKSNHCNCIKSTNSAGGLCVGVLKVSAWIYFFLQLKAFYTALSDSLLYSQKALTFLGFLKWLDSLNKSFKTSGCLMGAHHETSIRVALWLANVFWLAKSLKQYRQCTHYSLWMFTEVSCLLPQKSTKSGLPPSNSMYFSNKKGCLYSNQAASWKAGERLSKAEGKKTRHETTRSLFNRKQSDGSWLGFHRKDKQALTGLF